MKHLIFLLLLLSQTVSSGQNRKEIVRYQLKSKTEHKADYKDGNGKFQLDEVTIYNKRENVIK